MAPIFLPLAAGAGATAAAGGLTAAGIGTGLLAAGTVAQGVSAMQTGRFNQKIAQQEAQQIRQANLLNEQVQRQQFEAIQGENIARTGAAGIELTGSPLEVMIQNAMNYERDRLIREYNAEVGARKSINQGALARQEGDASLLTSVIRAGGQTFRARSLLKEKD